MNLYMIFAPHDYINANHKELWKLLAEQGDTVVYVVDVPSDLIVTRIKNKQYRIEESRLGVRQPYEGVNLYVFRPSYMVRPELSFGLFGKQYVSVVKRTIVNHLLSSGEEFTRYKVKCLVYDPFWIKLLVHSELRCTLGYYVFDEVRYNINNTINRRQMKADVYACTHSDVVFAMSDNIRDLRLADNKHVVTVGNGASRSNLSVSHKFKNSVAFIGNFRDWIDVELLKQIILANRNICFYFVGNIESNMRESFTRMLNSQSNTAYLGKLNKEQASAIYKAFDCIIVPYLQGSRFIHSSRPLKVAEAVMNGVPVVTIPVSGYRENMFIRFAHNEPEFTEAIRSFQEKPINTETQEFMDAASQLSWRRVCEKIIEAFEYKQ